jgi:thiamine biosynthesis lipoprotein
VLFGADASIQIHGVSDTDRARGLTRLCFEEMRRMEGIFSLFEPASAINALNRHGKLESAPRELVAVVRRALELSSITQGSFDITIQPLWKALDAHDFRSGPVPESTLNSALARVNYRRVAVSGDDGIAFTAPGTEITLNGIAQGYITDRIALLLRENGVERALVNMGEYRALKDHPEGRPWEIGIRVPGTEDEILDTEALEDTALSVSGGYGYVFDPEGSMHHLLDPRNGRCQPVVRTVVVTASEAVLADAISTACAVSNDAEAHAIAKAAGCRLRIM